FVSRLCHEPRVGARVLEDMLARYLVSGTVTMLLRHRPTHVDTEGDRVQAVGLVCEETGHSVVVSADTVRDGAELAVLLELGSGERVVGAAARSVTGESRALAAADPLDQQAITWCFGLEYRRGEDHTIDRPATYGHWRDTVAPFWPGP